MTDFGKAGDKRDGEDVGQCDEHQKRTVDTSHDKESELVDNWRKSEHCARSDTSDQSLGDLTIRRLFWTGSGNLGDDVLDHGQYTASRSTKFRSCALSKEELDLKSKQAQAELHQEHKIERRIRQ